MATHQSEKPQTVLLIRVLAHAELHNTHEAPDQVRRAFPGVRLAALGAVGCEDTAILSADPRLDDLLLMPSHVSRSVRGFRSFMAAQPCDATVMCFGATPGVNYPKQILASLLCPGRKFFLNASGWLFPALSAAGFAVIVRAFCSVFGRALLRMGILLLTHFLRAISSRTPKDIMSETGLPEAERVRRILFIRLDHIGDMAMSLPALHALRQRYPDAGIDALVLPSVAPILADVLDVSEVIPYAAPVFTRGGGHAGLRETLTLLRRLRRARYDVAVDLRGNDLCRLIAFFAGARRRIGPGHSQYELPGKPNYDFLLTHPVSLPDDPEHAVERSLQTLHACGLPLPQAPYRLPVAEERVVVVGRKLSACGVGGAYAVIHARPSEESREWSPDRFAAVADHLVQTHGLCVLLTGGPRDQEYNADVRARVAHPDCVFNVAGEFSLSELPALFREASLMVSVDTGPMHVAAAVGTPLVTLFHPGLARMHHPYGQKDGVLVPPLVADTKDRVWDNGILSAIREEDVLAMVDRKLYTSAKISLRLVSNSSDVISDSSSNSFNSVSRSLRERVPDAA